MTPRAAISPSLLETGAQTRTSVRRSTSKMSAEVTQLINEHNVLVRFIQDSNSALATSVSPGQVPDKDVYSVVKNALDRIRNLRPRTQTQQSELMLDEQALQTLVSVVQDTINAFD